MRFKKNQRNPPIRLHNLVQEKIDYYIWRLKIGEVHNNLPVIEHSYNDSEIHGTRNKTWNSFWGYCDCGDDEIKCYSKRKLVLQEQTIVNDTIGYPLNSLQIRYDSNAYPDPDETESNFYVFCHHGKRAIKELSKLWNNVEFVKNSDIYSYKNIIEDWMRAKNHSFYHIQSYYKDIIAFALVSKLESDPYKEHDDPHELFFIYVMQDDRDFGLALFMLKELKKKMNITYRYKKYVDPCEIGFNIIDISPKKEIRKIESLFGKAGYKKMKENNNIIFRSH